MRVLARLVVIGILAAGGGSAAASSLSFELRGVVPVVCDAAVGALRISGNRATIEIARHCNTEHLLVVSFASANLSRPGAARFLIDGRRLTADRSAGAALRLPAHFSGTRRLVVEAAAGDLVPLLGNLRISVQPI